VGFSAAERLTDLRYHAEARTWLTFVNNVGISGGTVRAGWIVVGTWVAAVFGMVAAVLAGGVLVSPLGRPRQ
jgi:hypothetical protein